MSAISIVAIVAIGAIITFLTSPRGQDSTPPHATTTTEYAGIAPEALNTTEESVFRIDAPHFMGDPRDFDVLANVEWAHTIARNWSHDAVLTGIRIAGLLPGGHIDITRDGSRVTYAFGSPIRFRAAQAAREVTTDIPPAIFEVYLRRGRVGGHLISCTGCDPRGDEVRFDSACSLPRVFDLWRQHGLVTRPAYTATLDKYSWGVGSRGGGDVDPVECTLE